MAYSVTNKDRRTKPVGCSHLAWFPHDYEALDSNHRQCVNVSQTCDVGTS